MVNLCNVIPFSPPNQPRKEVFPSSPHKWGDGSKGLRSQLVEQRRASKNGLTPKHVLLVSLSCKKPTRTCLPHSRPRRHSAKFQKGKPKVKESDSWRHQWNSLPQEVRSTTNAERDSSIHFLISSTNIYWDPTMHQALC